MDKPAPRPTIRVTAPCRLHFGMFGFGQPNMRQFGGVGLMIQPAPEDDGQHRCTVEVEISSAERFQVSGDMPERTTDFVRRFTHAASVQEPACGITVRAPRQHTGLGVGTALGMSIALGLQQFLGTSLSPNELARSVGRARRSAVGVHGFFHGGLIVEAGKLTPDEISPLAARVELPESWRFVLLCPRNGDGLAGQDEIAAFESLPPVPASITGQACREVLWELLPAAASVNCRSTGGNFDAFAASLHRFGELAGGMFAARQHGAYATAHTESIVQRLRGDGIPCVVQSSWGPTLAVPMPNASSAADVCQRLPKLGIAHGLEVQIVRPANQGFLLAIE